MGTPNTLFGGGREALMGPADWLADTIKCVLVDLDDWGKAVTGATNATPIVVTSASHGFVNGDVVAIVGVGGNTAANGVFKVANQTTNTIELTDANTGSNVAGNGAYTSGGRIVKVSGDLTLNDIPSAARVATSAALTTKTIVDGVVDADDTVFTSASGDPSEAVVIFKDTGTATTSPLLAFLGSMTGLPVTPNGANINLAWDNGANKIWNWQYAT